MPASTLLYRGLVGCWLLLLPMLGFAQGAGGIELSAIEQLLTGNLGLAIGLLIAVWGIWKMAVDGEVGGGIFIIICGVLLTVFPGVFNSALAVVTPLVQSLTGR